MTRNLTQQFTDALHAIGTVEITDAVRHQAKRCLLDYIGAGLAGSRILHEQLHSLLDQSCSVERGVTAIGLGRKTGLESASLVNGISSHAVEMDDGCRFGMIHPGSPVLSAILPMAEFHDVSCDSLLRGIIAGYEAALRLSVAVQPTHYHLGYHPTATCGAVGAAAGIAVMLGFSAEETEAAISAAAMSAGGSLRVVDEGSGMKPFNVGRAAVTGMVSSLAAKAGFRPPIDALSGKTGFLEMHCEQANPKKLTEPADSGYWILKNYVKPYAACRHAHPAIEACIRYLATHPEPSSHLEKVIIATYAGLSGRHDHQTVSDVSSARMSVPFSCAIALVKGSAGVQDFCAGNVQSPEIIQLAKRIYVETDERLTVLLPNQRVAEVVFHAKEGSQETIRIDQAKGEPENPLTDEELSQKFENLAGYAGVSPETIDSIKSSVWSFSDSTHSLFNLL